MNGQRSLHGLLGMLLGTLLGVVATHGAEASRPAPSASAVPVTVTPAMGDPGGRFFGRIPEPAKTRHYYIAAEPVLWNFAPEGRDPVHGKTLPSTVLLNRSSWKIRYVQYADPDFSARVLPDERLGILGPVIRGVAGEFVAVTFLNRAWLPLSMHPHGVHYDKDSEGSYYQPAPGRGAAVAPGAKFTYVWQLDAASAPRPDEPSSKAWLYHSHVSGDEEANLGLIGFIVVTDPARARPDGTPRDVDREMGALFKIFDESNASAEAEEEADERPAGNTTSASPVQRTWAESRQLAEEGERHTINGYVFGNLPGLEMNEGERVRWYLFGLGSEKDFHTACWEGLRALENARRQTDAVELLPGSMKVADTLADNPGQWLLRCHVAEHMAEGMFARVTVHPHDQPAASREPESSFFGLPQSSQTLRFTTAELSRAGAGSPGEIFLDGQVTVPDPFPLARNSVAVTIGTRTAQFRPDASGIASGPDGILLIKNVPPYGNGNIRGGRLNFELTLKGPDWQSQLPSTEPAHLEVILQVGAARHVASCTLRKPSEGR